MKNATKSEPARHSIPVASSEMKICANCSTVAVVQKNEIPAQGMLLLPEIPATVTVSGRSVIPVKASAKR